MAKFKKLIPLLLCGAMCVSFAFGTACNTESGDDAEDDTNISNTETPDDGTGSGETETPDDGTGSGESEIVYTVTESEWDAALSYEKTLNCTASVLVSDGTYGSNYTGYLGLSESDGVITGKVYWHRDYIKTVDGVDDVYSSVDQYEYQTNTYRIYAKNYSDSSDGETEYSIEYTTEGYYDRLVSLINLDNPLFLYLNKYSGTYFNYSDFEYDETVNEYVYNNSEVSVTVIFENGYVTYVKLYMYSEGGYWECKYSDYGTTNVEEYFTDEVMAGISEYYESLNA